MKNDILKAIEEFKHIDCPRGDLQGICEARSFEILKKSNPNFSPTKNLLDVFDVSGKILQGIDDYRFDWVFRLSLHPNPQETNTQFRRKSPPPDRSEATLGF